MTVCAACGHELPEGAKFCLECGAPVAPAAAPREQRKTVTILFCDVAGSTELGESTDPEALRALLARYFVRMKEMVERHGGTVEKFVGDAVMAVFGVPVVHEDDALRACRAAVEMRDALPELGIRGRIGVNTGEVVTGTEERLATGDAVNVAARLEQAAEPGEVLVGGKTVRLVRDAVELGEERRLDLKGKSEPVAAFPLLSASGEARRRFDTPIASLLGESDEPATADEIAWAFRKLLEEASPVVCVFDDLHWAEPTFLDLVDHVVDWSRDAPILLVCIARPELLDRRSTWAGGKLNATTVLLEPLTSEETDELIERLLGDAELAKPLRARIREAAEGNPLFVEQMLAMVAESPNGDIIVPPTIQALLAARLDQLDPSERGILERGSVEGKIFHRGGVEALAPDEGDVPTRLMALVRKELVRPDRTQLLGDDAFRFRHLLIRDAAYDGLPKAARAELHERFAAWLEAHGSDLIELDEILGYHLEQAYGYRVELGLGGEETHDLAGRAAERLEAAGERALARSDVGAAIALLERARRLLPPELRPLSLELNAMRALHQSGDLDSAIAIADATIDHARAAGDRGAEHRGMVLRGVLVFNARSVTVEELQPVAEEAIEVFTELGDDGGLADAWSLIARAELGRLQWRAMAHAADRTLEHAERSGDPAVIREARLFAVPPRLYGPFPVEEALAFMSTSGALDAYVLSMSGQLEAMRGNFDVARQLVREGLEYAEEHGRDSWQRESRCRRK